MDTKMYEMICPFGEVHYTVRSKDKDEVVDAGVQHGKRVHGKDFTPEEVGKLVKQVVQPQSAK